MARDLAAHDCPGPVEDGDDLEALGAESRIGQQRAADVAGPDQHDLPRVFESHRAAQAHEQVTHAVADPGLATGPDAAKILAHLRVGHAGRLAELAAADAFRAILDQARLQRPQVQAQAPDGRLRDAARLWHGGSVP